MRTQSRPTPAAMGNLGLVILDNNYEPYVRSGTTFFVIVETTADADMNSWTLWPSPIPIDGELLISERVAALYATAPHKFTPYGFGILGPAFRHMFTGAVQLATPAACVPGVQDTCDEVTGVWIVDMDGNHWQTMRYRELPDMPTVRYYTPAGNPLPAPSAIASPLCEAVAAAHHFQGTTPAGGFA